MSFIPLPSLPPESFLLTHDGCFHADDACGCAILLALLPGLQVIRSRDPSLFSSSFASVDVGGVHDEDAFRFDHHQKGFSLARQSSIPFASAGLVWRRFGPDFVRFAALQHDIHEPTFVEASRVASDIDDSLVAFVDAEDSGHFRPAPGRFGLSSIVDSFVPSWEESVSLPKTQRAALYMESFMKAVELCSSVLVRACVDSLAALRAETVVLSSERLLDGRLLVLPRSSLPWHAAVSNLLPGVLLVAYADSSGEQWQLATVPVKEGSFDARMELPASWAGLRDAELASETSVQDAVFCHNGLFIAGARSREGILSLAKKALEPRH